ncbi:MAG: SDR family NAD(P)-dependent oxidoreductase, partial [Dehalococcoidia bacterium]
MNKVIIIGATSGIGKELAKIFSSYDYEVGIVGRRTNLLKELASELPTKTYPLTVDIKKIDEAIKSLEGLLLDMQEVDIIVISAGTGHINMALDW